MVLFNNKYRIESSRLPNHDYGAGIYFVTICVGDNVNHFGKIKNQEIFLSKIGKLVDHFWQEIPRHFENVKLDEYVVMPDHFHGIVVIGRDVAVQRLYSQSSVQRLYGKSSVQRLYGKSSAQCPRSKSQVSQQDFYRKISPKSGSLSAVIRSFKSICTREINKIYPKLNFSWQERFYDAIIRNKQDLQRVRCYIRNNPKNWQK